MKKCPYCAEEIQEEAIKCRFCGEWLETKAPPVISDNVASSGNKNPEIERIEATGEENEIGAYKQKFSTMPVGELLKIQRGYDPQGYLPEARKALEEVFLTRKDELELEKKLSNVPSVSEKNQKINPPIIYYDRVGGWLSLFCLGLVIFGPLVNIIAIVSIYRKASRLFSIYPRLKTIIWIDSLLGIGLVLFGLYVGFKLYTIQKSAPEIAKKFLLALLGYSFFELGLPSFVPSINEIIDASQLTQAFIRQLVFVVIWYAYITYSKRVKATYGA